MDNPSTEQDIELFQDFMGVGYFFHDVRPNVLLIFDNRRALVNTWSKIIKWWPDPDIRMVLIEKQNPASYEFYLHSDSKILNTKWVFLKSLKMSEHYTRFKSDYDGAANLGLALYRPKDDSYELEIFKYKKRVTNVTFQAESESITDTIVQRSKQVLKFSSEGTRV
jgi:hypothetical protein